MATKTKKKPRPKQVKPAEPAVAQTVAIHVEGVARVMTAVQVAAELGIAPRTLRKLVAAGGYPKPRQLAAGSGLPRWSVEDHNAWVASKFAAKTGQGG